MIWTRSNVFTAVKDGNSPAEWEDGAALRASGPESGPARFVVVDGATAAIDVRRWVNHLTHSFVDGPSMPLLSEPALRRWFADLQQQWADQPPKSFSSPIAERKYFEQGSFATFLGCEVNTGSPTPSWQAAAIGDTVLFHVRQDTLQALHPPMRSTDFGYSPALVHTRSHHLDQMMQDLRIDGGPLEVGDTLFLASDALAQWMLRCHEYDIRAVWRGLADLAHPSAFHQLIGRLRATNQLANDDVTLLRVNIDARPPSGFRVCL